MCVPSRYSMAQEVKKSSIFIYIFHLQPLAAIPCCVLLKVNLIFPFEFKQMKSSFAFFAIYRLRPITP